MLHGSARVGTGEREGGGAQYQDVQGKGKPGYEGGGEEGGREGCQVINPEGCPELRGAPSARPARSDPRHRAHLQPERGLVLGWGPLPPSLVCGFFPYAFSLNSSSPLLSQPFPLISPSPLPTFPLSFSL